MTCSGIYTALITPFDERGEIDEKGFCFHIKRSKDADVAGIVVLGTTGESTTLTAEERERLLFLARKSAGTLSLMAGCGAASTKQTLENIHLAARCGFHFALISPPYYNRPTQEGIYRHFESLARMSPLPIVLYNIPGRTAINIEITTFRRLISLPNIVGIKESSGNFNQAIDTLACAHQERPGFSVFCGDDSFILPFMALGACGVISGGANLIPKEMQALMTACQKGDFLLAKTIHTHLVPLFNALRLESNPIPLKAALQLAGLPGGLPRPPLTPLDPQYFPQLEAAWSNAIQTF